MAAIGFAITDPENGVAHYRGAVPADVLRARGHTVVVSDVMQLTPAGTLALALAIDPERPVAWEPDVVILTGGWPSAIELEWISEARASGQRVFVDVDDWPRIPPSNPHADSRLFSAKVAAIARADALICSTPVLARGMGAARPAATVVSRNRVDAERFAGIRTLNTARAERYGDTNPDPVVIAWRGGVAFHLPDLALLRDALDELGRDESVRFVHVGHTDDAPSFASVVGIPEWRVERRPLVTFGAYPPNLLGVDLALVPLDVDTPFSLAKSNIAGMEWTAAGVPFLASEHPEYRALVDRDQLLPRRARHWRGALRALIDPVLRGVTRSYLDDALHELPWTLDAAIAEPGNAYETLFDELDVADPRGSAPAEAGAEQCGEVGARPRHPQDTHNAGGNRK